MGAKFEEIQRAFSEMQHKWDDYVTQCRNASQALREDFAAYLDIPAANVQFVRPDVLDESSRRGTIGIPELHNDAYDAGDFDEDGWYRIGLSFGLSAISESEPCWYPIMSLRFKRNSDGFVAQPGESTTEFELGSLSPSKVRSLSEWIADRMINSAKASSQNMLLGRRKTEMGYHVK